MDKMNEEQEKIYNTRLKYLSQLENIDIERNKKIENVMNLMSELRDNCDHDDKFIKVHYIGYDRWLECEICGKEI
jgi:hypothetical protein